MIHNRSRLLRGTAALAATAVLAGCGVKQSYYKDLESYIVKNQYAAAQEHVQKEPDKTYPQRDRLLYYFDLAMTAHLAGDYAKSNEALYAAEKAIEDLYSKSVSKQAASFLVNDNVKEYAGEDFEMVVVHVIAALNYVFMNQLDDALVEARKVDLKLKVVAERTGGKKVAYQTDAFARYLAGMIHENKASTEELNEAYISYKQALEAYAKEYQVNYKTPVPAALVNDALRTAMQLGFSDFEEEIRKEYAPNAPKTPKGKTSGEVVVIHYTGLAPQKVDFVTQVGAACGTAILQTQEVPEADQSTVKNALMALEIIGAVAAAAATSGQGCSPALLAANIRSDAGQAATAGSRAIGAIAAQGNVITLAIPDFRKRPAPIRGSEVVVAGTELPGGGIKSDLVEDIEAIGIRSLQDRIGRVLGKAIARAVVKFAIAQGSGAAVEQFAGGTWGKIVKAAVAAGGAATEEADKRSWRTLPGQILISRVPLPPGRHNLTVKLLDENGAAMREVNLEGVEVKAGKKTFVRVVSMEAKGVE
ncbi:MAG: hypothetical protein HYT87_05125 [Nitrospirae bacterium]|nr:hypothetical protein [Nitrospirota bacterium]